MQADAHKANVALARPVRVPYVRPAVSSVLGTTFTAASRVMKLPRETRHSRQMPGTCTSKYLFISQTAKYPLSSVSLPAQVSACCRELQFGKCNRRE